MDRLAQISEILAPFRGVYPAGFAIGLHLSYAAPKYLFQAYDPEWADIYVRDGFILHDPTVRWGLTHTGAVRWSAIDRAEDDRVMTRAAAHGLRYGVTVALDAGGTRSVAGFARADREAHDDEIARLHADLARLHDLTQTLETVTPDFHDTLKRMSIFLSRG